MRELVSKRLRSTSGLIVLVWIALNISYYGLFLWLPFVLAGEEKYDLNVYVLLTLIGARAVPRLRCGHLARGALGRKPTLALFLALGGVAR